MSLLTRENAALVVIDVQESFRPYASFAGVAEAAAKLLAAARILNIPALVSEQYPKGLGASVPEIGLHEEPVIEKSVFSAARADGFGLNGGRFFGPSSRHTSRQPQQRQQTKPIFERQCP